MTHPDRKLAKNFDMPGRAAYFTAQVYAGADGSWDNFKADQKKRLPEPPKYNAYFGELHGHANLADGRPDIDTYFKKLRDNAKLDVGALADHEHGGVGKPELWNAGKWELIKSKVKEYYAPGSFTTILAYERDSYPWYNNIVVYYNNHDGELLRGVRDGEMTRKELHRFLAREDLILVPHDTNVLSSGADFLAMDLADMVPIIQVYSRGSCAEFMGDPLACYSDCEGGHWQDALRRGAKMGCIACSDDHSCTNGITLENGTFPTKYPGITGGWAEENTVEGIFGALRAKRCWGFMGGRITVDFRIDGHYMGEEITRTGDPAVYYKIEADAPIESVTIVKNCRDYIIMKKTAEQLFYDYKQELACDCYYLRVKLTDGRQAWSSPIWVNQA